MVAIVKVIDIPCEERGLHQIEQFVEDLSNNLFINETYFGNILTSLTLLFNRIIRDKSCKQIEIKYKTDYKTVNIFISGIARETLEQLTRKVSLENTGQEKEDLFLIQTLIDGIRFSEFGPVLELIYDISAVHDQVYNERKSFLQKYFQKEPDKEAAKNK